MDGLFLTESSSSVIPGVKCQEKDKSITMHVRDSISRFNLMGMTNVKPVIE